MEVSLDYNASQYVRFDWLTGMLQIRDISTVRKYRFYIDACNEFACSMYGYTRQKALVTFSITEKLYSPPIYPILIEPLQATLELNQANATSDGYHYFVLPSILSLNQSILASQITIAA